MNRASSGLAVLLCVAACARPASKTDFIKDAIQGDIGEIQLGQLAEQKASKPDVRDFGEMLVTDHTQSRSDAETVASQLSLTPPTDLTGKDNGELNKLQGLSGDAFDKEFVRYMADAHKADIAMFQRAAKSKDERVSKFAADTLPVLQKHLDRAQALENGG